MKCYKLPARISGLIFDMDGTLYTHEEYLKGQIDTIIAQFGKVRGKSFEEAREAVESYQSEWASAHGGRTISLGNTLAAFGITVEEGIRWREELIEPSLYLREDPRLRETLSTLSDSFALALVTNNPVLVARKTLACLGVEEFFPVSVGLDTCGVSKPHEAPFIKAAELLGLPPKACVSIGDRYDIDLALPLELGMGGILVDGVEDVHGLPEQLAATISLGLNKNP
ncbi:HAD-superfamily hydrolase, subfamily IA, variant 1 [Treponema primitia ZAS-2]|uniref:phosphoglycolate phosphatase n=1 Tax=Treponema primitia (strain ATCC BAA-887 / DSM 12427 / ZAS-2) TaxID=545694 RepID=F5YQX6_TREPZ|nr:HAD family hydrolase [Treponema primitia]AEF83708.1 HAD-superfamily hydrolase, subfamily IA, variant 1 [Treponema primitia ZAS-2]